MSRGYDLTFCDEHRALLFEFLVHRTVNGQQVPADIYEDLYTVTTAYFGERPWGGTLQLTADGIVYQEQKK